MVHWEREFDRIVRRLSLVGAQAFDESLEGFTMSFDPVRKYDLGRRIGECEFAKSSVVSPDGVRFAVENAKLLEIPVKADYVVIAKTNLAEISQFQIKAQGGRVFGTFEVFEVPLIRMWKKLV